MMSSFFPLLIGIVLKLNNLIEVVSCRFLLNILENKVLKFHLSDPEGMIRVVVGFA